jgi:hypothetical protein
VPPLWTPRRAALGAVLALVVFVYVALTPFEWSPPQLVVNAAERTDGGGVRFAKPGILITRTAPAWVGRAMEANTFTVQLRARSFTADQSGPTRVLTLSRDHDERNLMIGQEGADLIVRIRLPGRDRNGMKWSGGEKRSLRVKDVFAEPVWRTVAVRVVGGHVAVDVDGAEALALATTERPLDGWSSSFPLALGNEGTWLRAWSGEIAEAVAAVGDERWDLLAEDFERPEKRWLGVKFELWSWNEPADAALNFLCFLPVGWLLARAWGVGRAVLVAALVCLVVEAVQVAFHFRLPSLRDWTLNVAGTALGAWVCARKTK